MVKLWRTKQAWNKYFPHQTLPEYQDCQITDTGFTVNYLDNAFAFPKGSPFRWPLSHIWREFQSRLPFWWAIISVWEKKVEGDDFGDICNTRKRGPSCFLIFSVRLLFNHALMKMDESGELQRIIGWACLPLSVRLDLNKICQLHFSTPHPYHWIHTIAGNTRQWFLTARGQKDVPLDFQGVNKNYMAHHFNTPTCINCPVSSGVRRHLMVVMVVMMVMGRKDKTDI